MTAIYLIIIALLVLALAVAMRANRNLMRMHRDTEAALRTARRTVGECESWLYDCINARDLPAAVATEWDETAGTYCFSVYRRVPSLPGHRLPICRYTCSPDDPEDIEYKRIHAEEVAEAINEKP